MFISNSTEQVFGVYFVLSIILSVLQVLTHLSLTTLWGRLWYLHFTDEETKAHRRE